MTGPVRGTPGWLRETNDRTALSLLVSKHGNANDAVWLRKSKITGERAIDSTTVELTMPDWLARSEKLS